MASAGNTGRGRASRRGAALFALVLALVFAVPALASADGSISGTVTAAQGGAAIEGVSICAYGLEQDEYSEYCTLSGAGGEYTISRLLDGPYSVEFRAGDEGLNFIGQAWDHKANWVVGDEVEVAGGPVTEIDAQLDPGGLIHGRVTDVISGAPLIGVEVCGFPFDEESVWSCTDSGANGEYTIAGLPAGPTEVTFWFGDAGYFTQAYLGKERFEDVDLVNVAVGGTVGGINAALLKAATISGQVTDAISHLPLAGAEVCAHQVENYGFDPECVWTAADGSYTVAFIHPGPYTVVFFPPGYEGSLFSPDLHSYYEPQFYPDVDVREGHGQILNLGPGAALTGIDAALWPVGTHPPRTVPTESALPKPAHVRCRKGFHRVTIKGKKRCVRKKKHRRRRHSHHKRRSPA